jgi:integrase
MRGQITKRGENTWLVRIQGRGPDGKLKSLFSKTVHGTKKKADETLTEALRAKDTGTLAEPNRLTVNEFLDKWLVTTAKNRLRAHTYEGYSGWLDRYVRPALGAKKIGALKALDIQSLYSDMIARGLRSRSIEYTHAILRTSLKQAVKWNIISRNPCDLVELPRKERKEMKALSPQEASRFLNHAKADKYGVTFSFALATGMRPNEYLALRWSDVDWERGTATVQRSLAWKAKGGYSFNEPKTSKSRRTVPLPATLLRELRSHRIRQAEHRLAMGSDYTNLDLVFANDLGTPIHHRNLSQRHFAKILTKASLPKFRLYDLRHSCATLLLSANENPKVVSERLGHASIVLTLDTYSHVLPDMQQAATEKLEAMLFG